MAQGVIDYTLLKANSLFRCCPYVRCSAHAPAAMACSVLYYARDTAGSAGPIDCTLLRINSYAQVRCCHLVPCMHKGTLQGWGMSIHGSCIPQLKALCVALPPMGSLGGDSCTSTHQITQLCLQELNVSMTGETVNSLAAGSLLRGTIMGRHAAGGNQCMVSAGILTRATMQELNVSTTEFKAISLAAGSLLRGCEAQLWASMQRMAPSVGCCLHFDLSH